MGRFSIQLQRFIKNKKIEQGENKTLIDSLNISSYPTIMLLDANNKKVKDYDGERTHEAFQKFVDSL